MLASSLLSEGYLQPAGDTSKAAAEGLSDTPFLDLSDAFYYFVSVVFWVFLLSQTYWCSAFLSLLVRFLKSWRKECTEMERSMLIVFFYVMFRMNCFTLIFVRQTFFFFSVTLLSVKWVLRSSWVLFNLDFVPGNFTSNQNLAISSPDDSVEGKRVIHYHGASQSGTSYKPIFVQSHQIWFSVCAHTHTTCLWVEKQKFLISPNNTCPG